MKKALTFLLVLTILTQSYSQNNYENLSKELLEQFKNSELTGFAVSIIKADSILYKKGFGFENIETKNEFTIEKRFYIASISKTFIGIGLMKLVEDGELELSTPINSILPFQVINPKYPDSEITIEQLARHTSTILNGDLGSKSWYLDKEFSLRKKEIGKTAYSDFKNWSHNSKITLGEFLKESLSYNGKLYSEKNFSNKKPGEQYQYSNLGAALAAYIIELKTGIEYDKYIENFVTTELNFEPGVWRHIPDNELPTTYFQTKVQTPNHRPILYPTGGMMLSCDELTLYLQEMIKGFNGNSQLLNSDSFQQMMSAKEDTQNPGGIFWELKGNKIGHNGGNYGVTCFMSFDKNTGIGKIFMTNISSYTDNELLKEMVAIWNKLSEYESKFE
ncbi:MAG: serine hydrolase [Flavobacteriaceae bacterium]